MNISSRTPEGWPGFCSTCGKSVTIEPSSFPIHDAPCPHCGELLIFDVASEPGASRISFTSRVQHWFDDKTDWKKIYFSPLVLCVAGIHLAMISLLIYTDLYDSLAAVAIAMCCILYPFLGAACVIIGWRARRNYYRMRAGIEHGLFPEEIGYPAVHIHRALIGLGSVMMTPAIWLIVFLLKLIG